MNHTPYDHLTADGTPRRNRTNQPPPWMTRDEWFEELIVQCLLERYGLSDTRTRFFLIDVANRHLPRREKRNVLTLAAFNQFFPAFPVLLHARLLLKSQIQTITVPKLLLTFESTAFYREYADICDLREKQPPALIFSWPHVLVEDSLTVHNFLPVNANAPGCHTLCTFSDGSKLALEPFAVMLDTVDSHDPDHGWLASALRQGFMEECPHKHR